MSPSRLDGMGSVCEMSGGATAGVVIKSCGMRVLLTHLYIIVPPINMCGMRFITARYTCEQ